MDMTGERRIPAPRQIVWGALNDPEVLKASIPGCQTLEKLSDTEMKATAAVKLGPISARFTGNVLLSDIDPPNSYRISGEGQGGVAGFAKGGAAVTLTDDAADTLLSYQVNAQVGGKLAQLGARLIDASAKQMADAFFDKFSKQVQAMAPQPAAAPDLAAVSQPAAAPERAAVSQPAARPGPVTAPQPAGDRMNANAPDAELGGEETMAEPVAAAMAATRPAGGVSLWSLIPREPFGMPLAAWIGGGVFVIMMLLMLGSML
ncbi:SRPBCC family protein [Rhodopila sp.]|uniref:SRPBCC family protein n=1 Tax=Rhodopila sp. TaxID=2480087 RepID=UPI003D0DB220